MTTSHPLKRTPVASPCTGVCRIDPRTGWCEGCARSLDEIAAWGSLDTAQQRAIWKQLPGRRAALVPPESR
jgi:uncharacterized protein